MKGIHRYSSHSALAQLDVGKITVVADLDTLGRGRDDVQGRVNLMPAQEPAREAARQGNTLHLRAGIQVQARAGRPEQALDAFDPRQQPAVGLRNQGKGRVTGAELRRRLRAIGMAVL